MRAVTVYRLDFRSNTGYRIRHPMVATWSCENLNGWSDEDEGAGLISFGAENPKSLL